MSADEIRAVALAVVATVALAGAVGMAVAGIEGWGWLAAIGALAALGLAQ